MILGMSVATFTVVHVIISIVGILSGIFTILGMISNRPLGAMNGVFLVTTFLASVTGLLFRAPFDPAEVIGVLSLLILAVAFAALYAYNLIGRWRITYVLTAALALYLNCFVAVVQAFQKIDSHHALAPTQGELPFVAAQGLVLAVVLVGGFIAVRRFQPAAEFA